MELARLQHLQRLLHAKTSSDACAADAAAACLRCLHASNSPGDQAACWQAARATRLRLLQWARAQPPPSNASTCQLAEQQLLQWARAHGDEFRPPGPDWGAGCEPRSTGDLFTSEYAAASPLAYAD
jgi:hypothetical protein